MLLIDVTPAISFMVKPPALKTIALHGVETSNKNPLKFRRATETQEHTKTARILIYWESFKGIEICITGSINAWLAVRVTPRAR